MAEEVPLDGTCECECSWGAWGVPRLDCDACCEPGEVQSRAAALLGEQGLLAERVTVDGAPCEFPFVFRQRLFTNCTALGREEDGGAHWCVYDQAAWQAHGEGWGYCEAANATAWSRLDAFFLQEALHFEPVDPASPADASQAAAPKSLAAPAGAAGAGLPAGAVAGVAVGAVAAAALVAGLAVLAHVHRDKLRAKVRGMKLPKPADGPWFPRFFPRWSRSASGADLDESGRARTGVMPLPKLSLPWSAGGPAADAINI